MKRLLLICLLMVFAVLASIAQIVDTTGMNIDPAVPIPNDFVDLFDIKGWLAGVAEVAGLTVFLVAALVKYAFKSWQEKTPKNKIKKQVLAIGAAVVISLASMLSNFGYLADAVWYVAIAYGIGAAFLANGWFTYDVVKNILRFLKLKGPALPV